MATYYVDSARSDNSGDGLSLLTAKKTIQAAVNLATAGDTIRVVDGTYPEKVTTASSGNSGAHITLRAHSTSSPLAIITGTTPTGVYGNITCLQLNHDFWDVQGLTIRDSHWNDADFNVQEDTYYWASLLGEHNTITGCVFETDPTVDNVWAACVWAGGTWNFQRGRLLEVNGAYNVVEDSTFRGGSQGVVITGGCPRRCVIQRNTFRKQLWNNILVNMDGGNGGVNAEILIQYNTSEDTYGEDSIQFSRVGDAFDNNNPGAYELLNRGILVRGNLFQKAGENIFDLKACGATVTFEDNIVVDSYGADDGYQTSPVPYAPNDSGGAGFEIGYGDAGQYAIIRNNLIAGNHTGVYMHSGFHVFNNTFVSNIHSYRGYTPTDADYCALKTDNTNAVGFGETKKTILNNIFYGESPAAYLNTNVARYTNRYGQLESDYNLYYTPGSTSRFAVITSDYPNPPYITLNTLTAWKQYVVENADGYFDDWGGRPLTEPLDAHSIDADPKFVNPPSAAGPYDSAWDFDVASDSPANGAYGTLATARNELTNAVGGTDGTPSTTLVVRDTHFFHDGYGIPDWYGPGMAIEPNDPDRDAIVEADWIQIGSGSVVQIASISHSTGAADGTITLASARNWADDDPVHWVRNGVRVKGIGYRQTADSVVSDTTPPTVVAFPETVPADNATDVSVTTPLWVRFSETVVKNTGSIVLKSMADDSVVETINILTGSVVISGTDVSVTRSTALAYSTQYYIQITPGALRDVAGNDYAGVTNNSDWNFTTAPQGTTPTTVTREITRVVLKSVDGVPEFDTGLALNIKTESGALVCNGTEISVGNYYFTWTATNAYGYYYVGSTQMEKWGKLWLGEVTGNRNLADSFTLGKPLVVSDTTLVTNLNADLLDGKHASQFLTSDVATFTTDLTVTGSVRVLGNTFLRGGLQVTGSIVTDRDIIIETDNRADLLRRGSSANASDFTVGWTPPPSGDYNYARTIISGGTTGYGAHSNAVRIEGGDSFEQGALGGHVVLNPGVGDGGQGETLVSGSHMRVVAPLTVAGATTLNSTLGVTGTSTLNATNINGLLTLDANGIVKNDRILGSEAFVGGFTGSGWKMESEVSSKSRLELDELIVRGTMRVFELLIQQIRATNGSLWVTSCASVSASVYNAGPMNWTLNFVSSNGVGHPFTEGDILLAQRANISGGEIWRSVLEVVTVHNTGSIAAEVVDGANPAAGMDYVRIGNSSDADRRGSVYMTADEVGAPYMRVIDEVDTYDKFGDLSTVKTQVGRLTNITDPDFGPSPLVGYGIYTQNGYFKGNMVVSPSGSALALRPSQIMLGNITGTANSGIKISQTGTPDTSGVYGYTSSGEESFALRLNGTANVAGFLFTDTYMHATYSNMADGGTLYHNTLDLFSSLNGSGAPSVILQREDVYSNVGINVSMGNLMYSGAVQNEFGFCLSPAYTGAPYFQVSRNLTTNELTSKIGGWNFDEEQLYAVQGEKTTTLVASPSFSGLKIISGSMDTLRVGDFATRPTISASISTIVGDSRSTTATYLTGGTASWSGDTVALTGGTTSRGSTDYFATATVELPEWCENRFVRIKISYSSTFDEGNWYSCGFQWNILNHKADLVQSDGLNDVSGEVDTGFVLCNRGRIITLYFLGTPEGTVTMGPHQMSIVVETVADNTPKMEIGPDFMQVYDSGLGTGGRMLRGFSYDKTNGFELASSRLGVGNWRFEENSNGDLVLYAWKDGAWEQKTSWTRP